MTWREALDYLQKRAEEASLYERPGSECLCSMQHASEAHGVVEQTIGDLIEFLTRSSQMLTERGVHGISEKDCPICQFLRDADSALAALEKGSAREPDNV